MGDEWECDGVEEDDEVEGDGVDEEEDVHGGGDEYDVTACW